MKALRQIVLMLIVLAVGVYVWIAFVPAAQPFLARMGVYDLLGMTPPAPQEAAAQGRGQSGGAVPVVTARVAEQARADRITAIGDGRARRSVTVRSSAVGTITELTIASGNYVQAGTIIAHLQDEAEKIALEQAEIEYENANTEAKRITQLETSGAVTEVRLRESQLALRSAELAVRQAKFDLSQRQITAPISGWVGIIDLEEGDRVNAQDVLVTITDRSDILIDFRVPERVVGQIAVGQPIIATPLGQPGTELEGEISVIDSVVDRASRTLLVQGSVPNDADLLRAGMAFSVNLSFPGETLLSIAPLAVQWSSEGPFVWVVREGKVAQASVEIVQRNSDAVLVRADGLAADDEVVTEGVQSLRNGTEVSPRTDAASALADEETTRGGTL
ncbi:RND family efflux transporter, MFP subunit [Pseudosulfitobacter pseudonitzschiae]|uniref:Multidrug transporter n=1 Tax=Pseudosulfitobacter pseudonitzschiae TaxID=1402135 RepID=A0A073J3E9_9RHOB|nr:efflux RND transporter periplasmic adaptor subunit [Pseudosulfitobacter pseudonitzschiae]KEJ96494.1 multidrug transporter [Pseudosulfitobacter pseudonitzschiae]QKS08035.1 efflux RND transporter periplasmic adaptor subunit [Pseudosulfitobacter pseudonitzschiae]SHF33078.1 RND family efflux transporter, MFP subunit [Pseudosulfitobacter pseudonitzschiae]